MWGKVRHTTIFTISSVLRFRWKVIVTSVSHFVSSHYTASHLRRTCFNRAYSVSDSVTLKIWLSLKLYPGFLKFTFKLICVDVFLIKFLLRTYKWCNGLVLPSAFHLIKQMIKAFYSASSFSICFHMWTQINMYVKHVAERDDDHSNQMNFVHKWRQC